MYRGYNIILASQSPRRRELLSAMGIKFTTAEKYDVQEVCPEGTAPEDEALYLSQKKSYAYPFTLEDRDIVITSDTLVLINEVILGKPKNRDGAIKYLTMLSGEKHKVITAVTLRHKETYYTFSEETKVTFAPLSKSDIIYYVDEYKPYDKAGAYAIQEWIGVIGISKIEGTYFNIMGLPTTLLYKELNNFIDNLN